MPQKTIVKRLYNMCIDIKTFLLVSEAIVVAYKEHLELNATNLKAFLAVDT